MNPYQSGLWKRLAVDIVTSRGPICPLEINARHSSTEYTVTAVSTVLMFCTIKLNHLVHCSQAPG